MSKFIRNMGITALCIISLAGFRAFAEEGNNQGGCCKEGKCDGDKCKKDGAKKEKIALDKVPEAVMKAAKDAVQGLEVKEVEKVTKGETVVYEVDGVANGKKYEIKVSAEGKVISSKEDKEDDEDDKDDEAGDKD